MYYFYNFIRNSGKRIEEKFDAQFNVTAES